MKISYLGPAGTFTERALRQIIAKLPAGLVQQLDDKFRDQISGEFLAEIQLIPAPSQQRVIQNIAENETDFGCVPIESSLAGSVAPTLDGLLDWPGMHIYAETVLPIRFSLAAQGVQTREDLQDFSTVYVHPIAYQQVYQWIETHLPQVTVLTSASNAQAAADAARDSTAMAMTTHDAAKEYNLSIIQDGIIDDMRAETRFVLIGKSNFVPAATGHDRSSLAFDVNNVPGSLSAVIAELGMRQIDLIRLESRPKRDDIEENKYWFFVDFNGHIEQKIVQEALIALQRRCSSLYFFGSWEMAKPSGKNPPQLDAEISWLQKILSGEFFSAQ